MNKFFYTRLAWTNLRKNKSIYLPYLLASTMIIGLYYILSSVSIMVYASNMRGAASMTSILTFSTWLCGFLSFIILFYINSFVMKRRKKEFGLYSILGMEKRHISIVMLMEVMLTSILSIICGILIGALLSQLMFLLLLYIVGIPASLTFQIPFSSVLSTVLLFCIAFLFVLFYDIFSIRRTDPIALLHSAKEGEREPKSRWLLALIGFLTLGGGYFLAWRVKIASDALTVFFPAVLLVMIGTYCLFVAGSIVILKALKSKKRFYYKPQNFISISGMIYRMKQNAAGLSNICILSTCVLVTLSSCVCLYIGEEEILRDRFPRQIHISSEGTEEIEKIMKETSENHASQYGFTVENPVGYLSFTCISEDLAMLSSDSNPYSIDFITLSDYNRATGSNESLNPGEILVYQFFDGMQKESTISLGGHSYQIKKYLPEPEFFTSVDSIIVLSSIEEFYQLQEYYDSKDSYSSPVTYHYYYDVTGDNTRLQELYDSMRDTYNQTVTGLRIVSNTDASRNDFYQIYGSLLFVGIFFASLFLIATILIIYYKQITEGFDDHDRFQIMEKVGMSDKEVRKTIRKQVLMVFFLPLIVAVIHISVAFRVLCKLLLVFGMTNTILFLWCTLISVLIFSLLYFIVYQITAKTYYRIVQNRQSII